VIVAFYLFAALLVWFSFKSLTGGIAYLRYVRSELDKPPSRFKPFATVIVPCKGLDQGLDENLQAFFEQDYPEYEIVFVLDDADDPAAAVIESVTAQFRTGSGSDRTPAASRCIVAKNATNSAQKVECLREAVLRADPRSEVFIFADSDARPGRNWLSSLVAALENKNIGAATGYRWLIAPNPTLGSELCSAWNASIATMAIRRDTFERLGIREKWAGTLSDDFALTHAVIGAGFDIKFVPQALTASVEDCTFGEMLEFTTRQMKITRVYAPHLWLMSMFGSSLFCTVMIAAFLVVVLSRNNIAAVWAALVTLALVSAFSIGKSYLRLTAVRLVLSHHEAALRRQRLTQYAFWLLTPAVFLYNCIAALLSRRIKWRGTTYELKSPRETVIIGD
jgi:ceramide glucosyltransferase